MNKITDLAMKILVSCGIFLVFVGVCILINCIFNIENVTLVNWIGQFAICAWVIYFGDKYVNWWIDEKIDEILNPKQDKKETQEEMIFD